VKREYDRNLAQWCYKIKKQVISLRGAFGIELVEKSSDLKYSLLSVISALISKISPLRLVRVEIFDFSL